ncbi:MAG: DegV family protein [Clostridia bacterium]|nr:DegV family protein [Clostridia bacterium]
MIRIVTEAMSDLTRLDASTLGVTLVAQPLRFGMEEYLDDGISLKREDFFARLRIATELPRTSMVPMAFWLDAFNKCLRDPRAQVLCITGSSKLSGGHHSANMAREECSDPARVTVVDTLSGSCGEMLLVEEAARMRDEGASVEEIVARLEELRSRQLVFGLADELKYLVMGGRVSPLVGKVGGALNIKPTLMVKDGVIEKEGVVRGTKKGHAWYIEQLKKFPPDPSVPLYIGGADCPETVDLLTSMVKEAGINCTIRPMSIGCLVGTHVGPGLTLMSWIKAAAL